MIQMTQRPPGYYLWPIIIVSFLLAVMAFQITILVIAAQTSPMLVAENPYEQGVDYQTVIDRLELGKRLGWSITNDFGTDDHDRTRVGERRCVTLKAAIHDKEHKSVRAARVILTAVRPGDGTQDQKRELLEISENPGTYLTQFCGQSGLWLMRYEATLGSVSPRFEYSVQMP